jgi:hypothetical protein
MTNPDPYATARQVYSNPADEKPTWVPSQPWHAPAPVHYPVHRPGLLRWLPARCGCGHRSFERCPQRLEGGTR